MRCIVTCLLGVVLSACTAATPVSVTNPVAPRDDAWLSVAPAELGFDAAVLQRLARDLDAGAYANTHSVLVEYDGALVFEKYLAGEDESWGDALGFREFDAASLHDLRSISKSVTSLLLGIALGADFAAALERPVIEFFPELADRVEPGVEKITLQHLLTMSIGLEWNEMDLPYSNPDNDEIRMYYSGDPVAYTLGKPRRGPPGEAWYYNGGTTMVLAVITEKLSGKPFLEFAHEALFEPLGIARADVEWRGQGIFWQRSMKLPSAASGLRLRARDLAKIGSLMLHQGRWGERQIVPRGWIEASLQRHMEQNSRWDFGGIYGYGYQWWHGEFDGKWGRFTAICAVGYGGQRLCILPRKKLVVTVFAGNYGGAERGTSESIVAAVAAAAP